MKHKHGNTDKILADIKVLLFYDILYNYIYSCVSPIYFPWFYKKNHLKNYYQKQRNFFSV